jgi:hypothetical protein
LEAIKHCTCIVGWVDVETYASVGGERGQLLR